MVPTLIGLFNDRLLEDKYGQILYEAARLLGGIGDTSAVPDLIKVLEDSDRDEKVRYSAARAIALIGDPSFVPILIKVLGDSNRSVRICAVLALETMNDIRVVPPLIKALGDGGADMRLQAAVALGNINDISALKALEYIMKNDSDEDVRQAAFQASAKIRSSRGILEEEPTHKISAGGDIMIDSAKFSNTFSDSSTKISDVGMIKGNVGGKKEVPFSKCPYCGAE